MSDSAFQQTELIGREEELDKLKQSLDNAIEGKGSTTFISGEAGIGKTRLVDAFRELAATRNVKVLNGAASADISQPFLIFSKAFGKVMEKPLFEEQEIKKFVKIFAVNRSGLLAAQTSSGDEELDGDIFAGMLSAVQGFVRDSFDSDSFGQEGGKNASLGRLEYGDMKILMEHGEHLFLTAVFSGSEHPDMKGVIRRTLQEIEEKNHDILENWTGKMEELEPIQVEIRKLADAGFLVRRDLEGVKLENERIRIADDILEVLKRSSAEKPMVIFLEDLHWADESSLFVLNYLGRNIRSSHILIMATLRPRESAHLQEIIDGMNNEEILEEMVLEQLDLKNTVEIIDKTFAHNDFPVTLAERLYEQSKGNPLFVIEMLKGMHDDGSIAKHDGRYALVSESYQIPATVEEVVNRRLEALDPDTMAMVEYASCIGQRFDMSLAVSNRLMKEPDASLEKLLASGILLKKNGTVEFSHAVFQSVIYNSIGERWKNGHHKNLGEYFEITYADRLDEVIYDLARHFSRTKEYKKCTDYCTRAGEKAEGSYAMEQALEFYREALAALSGLDKTYARDRSLDILERIGDIQNIMGDFDGAIGKFRKAMDIADDKETKARMLRKIGTLHTNSGDFDKSLELMGKAKEVLEDASPQELGRILLGDGTTFWRKGEFDKAMELFKEALDTFTKVENTIEPGKGENDIAAVLNGIGNVHYTRGEMNDALEFYGRSLEIFEKIGNMQDVALLLGNVGGVYHGMGKLDDSLEFFKQSLEKREKIGDILGIAQTQNNIGVLYQDKGELDRALEALNHSLEIAEKLGSKVGISITLYNIGGLYHSKGELDRALGIYRRGLAIREEIGDKQGLAYSMYNLGRICNSKGELDTAKQHYEDCLAICLEIGDKQLSIHPLCSLAELKLGEGGTRTALEQVEKAVEIAADIGARGEEGLCHRTLAMVHREMKEWDNASEELKKAKTILEEVGHKEELARVHYEYASLFKARGEPEKAKEHLDIALSMFQEIGMKLWEEKARKALADL